MSGGHYPPSYHHIQPPQEFIAPRHRLPAIPPQGPTSSFNSSGTISHAHASHTPWINKHNFSNFHENASYYSQTTPKNYLPSTRTPHFNEESNWTEPPFSNSASLANAPYRGIPQNDKMESRICSNYSRDDVQQESMDLSSAAHVPTITSPKTNTESTNLSINGKPIDEPKDCSINGTAPKTSPKKEAVSVIAPNPLREKSTHIITIGSIITNETPHEPVIKTNKETVEEKVKKEPIPPDHVESILETMFHSDIKSSVTSTTSSVIVTAQSCKTPNDLRAESVENILKSPSPERCDNLESDLELNSSEFETTKEGELADVSSSVADLTIDLTADRSPELTIVENQDEPVKNAEPKVQDLSTHKTAPENEKIQISAPSEKIDPIDEQLALMDQFETEPAQVVEKDETKADKCDTKPVENQDTEPTLTSEPSKEDRPEKGKNRSEEITYVEVESELEKMFAGIEDTGTNDVDTDPLNSMPTDSSITDASKISQCAPVTAIKPPKKKSSKKSKSTSVKKDTKKHSLSKDTSSTDNVIFKRVPVIHVQGSKENPISVQIINSIKLEEDDISDAKTAKRKQGKSDRANKRLAACYSVKNYDPESSDESWICIFCKLSAHSPGVAGEPTGELFGPYFIRDPNQPDTDSDSKRHFRKTDHLPEMVKKKKLKKQKRSLSLESNHTSNSPEHKCIEIWAHENCFVWASGIHLVGSKLIGLDDSVIEALQTICAHCGENGASIGCRARHCKTFVHYSCALHTGWKLDPETFITVCSLHKGTH